MSRRRRCAWGRRGPPHVHGARARSCYLGVQTGPRRRRKAHHLDGRLPDGREPPSIVSGCQLYANAHGSISEGGSEKHESASGVCGWSEVQGLCSLGRSSDHATTACARAFFATVTPLSLRTRVGPGGRVGLKQDGCSVWRELDAEIRPAIRSRCLLSADG